MTYDDNESYCCSSPNMMLYVAMADSHILESKEIVPNRDCKTRKPFTHFHYILGLVKSVMKIFSYLVWKKTLGVKPFPEFLLLA